MVQARSPGAISTNGPNNAGIGISCREKVEIGRKAMFRARTTYAHPNASTSEAPALSDETHWLEV